MPEFKVHVELVTFGDFRGNGNYEIQSVGLSDLEIQGERGTDDMDSFKIRDTQTEEMTEDWTQEDYADYYGNYETESKPYEEWTQEDYDRYYGDLESRPVTACRLSTIPEETEDDVICS